MPGYSNLHASFQHSLQVATRFSRLTERLGQRLDENATYVMSNNDPRTAVLPTEKNKDGKITRYWRTKADIAFAKECKKRLRIVTEGMKICEPAYYRTRKDDPDLQTRYQAFNLVKLISLSSVDIEAGGGVEVKTGMPEIDTLLNEDWLFEQHVSKWLFEASVLKFIGVQLIVDDETNALTISRILPQNLFVKWDESGDDWTCISKRVFIPKDSVPDWEDVQAIATGQVDGFVLEERHYCGYYENYLYAVDSRDEIVAEVTLKYYDKRLHPVVLTGLQDFAITLIPNEMIAGSFVSDWDDVLDLNLQFNDRASREGELLNKFAAPQLMVGRDQLTYDPTTGKTFFNIPRNGVIAVRPNDNFTPSYLQPSVDAAASEQNRNFLLDMISILSQTSAVLLNHTSADSVDSGVAYKLKLTPTITKVKRRKEQHTTALKRLVFNLMCALDYYAEMNLAEQYVATAYESGEDERVKQAKMLEGFMRSGSGQISMDAFAESFSKVDLLSDTDSFGFFTANPADAKLQEDLKYLADLKQLQHLEDRGTAMQSIIRLKEIDVQMRPNLPQDTSTAIERIAGQQSMSLHRLLVEVDGLSEEAAAEEIERIQQESEAALSADPMNGFGMPTANDDFGLSQIPSLAGAPEETPEVAATDTGYQREGAQSIQLPN